MCSARAKAVIEGQSAKDFIRSISSLDWAEDLGFVKVNVADFTIYRLALLRRPDVKVVVRLSGSAVSCDVQCTIKHGHETAYGRMEAFEAGAGDVKRNVTELIQLLREATAPYRLMDIAPDRLIARLANAYTLAFRKVRQ